MAIKTITSAQNPRVKNAIRLRSARHRAKQGRFLIDGARELQQAICGQVRLAELFICTPLCKSTAALELLASLDRLDADLWHVPPEVFKKLAFGNRHDGVLAVAETPGVSLSELHPVGGGLIAVLEGLEKPGNVGAVLRNADGAGVAAVIVADPRTDLYNPNCIRASLGTLFAKPVCAADTTEVLDWLIEREHRIFAARPDAAQLYTEVDLSDGAAVAFGSEAQGLSGAWNRPDVTPIKLPMHGTADSLNVSAASAAVFYEALRQRTCAP